MRIRSVLWPLALLALVSGSCDRRPAASDEKVLRFINRGDIFTLNLNEMAYAQDIRVTYMMREGLYSPTGPQWTPVPAGATSCDVSPDGRVYTFHLRPGAKWSNGDAVTSADYAFSWRSMLEDPGEYTYLFYYVDGAEAYKDAYAVGRPVSFGTVGIETPDPLTLRVRLHQPVPYFLDIVAFTPFYPRNERSMEPFAEHHADGRVTYDGRYTRPPYVVTNGPFTLDEWQFKRILKFKKNPNYWDSASIKLDGIDMVVNDNLLSGYLQYSAKAIDWICVVPAEIGPDLRDKGVEGLKTSPSFGTEFLTTNTQPKLPGGADNPLHDPRVRRALAMAIDKSFITGQITRMGEAPATHFIPPGTIPGFVSSPGLSFDRDKARQSLADAGFPGGKGFPRLTILYNSESTTRARIVQVLKQQWQQALGIQIEIENVEGASYKQRIVKHDFALALAGWYGDYADVSTFTDKYLSSGVQNEASYDDPRYDKLLAAAAREPDAAKRFDLLRQAEALLNNDVPIVPLYHPVNVSLIAPRVSGMPVNPRSLVDWKAVRLQEAS